MEGVVSKTRSFAAAVALGVAATAFAGAAEAQLSRATIGTNPAGTLYNQIGTAAASVLQEQLDIAATARPFSGTSVYLPQLQRGEIAFGMNSAIDSEADYRGEEEYGQPLDNLRVMILLVRAPYGIFAREDSGLTQVAELADRPVVTGYRAIASFDRVNAALLATAGLTFDDLDAMDVSGVPDAVRAVVDERAVAAGSILGIPALREADATVSGGLRVLALGEDHAPITGLPGFSVVTVEPGPAYVGVREPTAVAQFDVYLNTGTHISDDDAYAVVKALHENWSDMQQAIPALRAIPAGDLAPSNVSIPYHPGAVRYYQEAGLWTEAHQARQDELLSE